MKMNPSNFGVRELLQRGRLQFVGSVYSKVNPRDLDIVLVIPDAMFKRCFGMSVLRFEAEGRTGRWSADRFRWGRVCLSLNRMLQRRLRSDRPLDVTIIPSGSLYAHH